MVEIICDGVVVEKIEIGKTYSPMRGDIIRFGNISYQIIARDFKKDSLFDRYTLKLKAFHVRRMKNI